MVGIYIIRCSKTNKVYIGQSRFLEKRFSQHINKLKRNKHENQRLQNAFNKYGKDAFSYSILEVLDEKEFQKEKLDLLEIKYISLYDSTNRDFGYNLDSGGNGKGRASEETRKKLSKAMKGKYIGRKISEETKALMRKNHSHYWLGKHHSEETKKLYSLQRKGKPSHLKGKTQTKEHIKKRTDCQNGKVWVNNGNNSKFVTQDEAQQLVSMGYVYGRPFFKRTKGRKYQYNGKLLTIPQISELCGINKFALQQRIRSGWCLEKATTTPIKK